MNRDARTLPLLALAVLALLAGACSSDDAGGSDGLNEDRSGPVTPSNGEVTIVASGIAWDIDDIVIPAGKVTTFIIESEDAVAHNINIKDAGPDGDDLKTELETGPVTQKLDVEIAEAGEYTFICDIHPNMEGTITVEGDADAEPDADGSSDGSTSGDTSADTSDDEE